MHSQKYTLLVLIGLFFLMTACQPSLTKECRKAIKELDSVLDRKEDLERWKLNQTSRLRTQLQLSSSPSEQYRLCKELYEAYSRDNVDSATVYAHRKLALALEINEKPLLAEAYLDLANRYLISGLHMNVLDVLHTLEQIPGAAEQQQVRYYQTYYTLYHNLALSVNDPVLKQEYLEKEAVYQELSKNEIREDMLGYYTINANILIGKGETAEARKMLESFLEKGEHNTDEHAIIHYWLAKTYRADGNKDKALEHYATSARYDFIGPYKASRSLVQTSRLLLEKGQIDKAYKYITRNYEDAIQADANICLNEIENLMPVIISSYNRLEKQRLRQIAIALAVVLILLVISTAALVGIRSLQVRLSKAYRKINSVNTQLKQNVIQLKEVNDIKDSYLGRYLSMFSSHIGSLENYRSSIRGVAKSMDLHEIQQALRSDDFINAERATLYEEFDRAFLGIFPDFVRQFNALLQEDKQIGTELPAGKLSNELRIFALMRLGVSEPSQIARFLKMAPSTVYNYRVKIRNAARCKNEDFEKELMRIGRFS